MTHEPNDEKDHEAGTGAADVRLTRPDSHTSSDPQQPTGAPGGAGGADHEPGERPPGTPPQGAAPAEAVPDDPAAGYDPAPEVPGGPQPDVPAGPGHEPPPQR